MKSDHDELYREGRIERLYFMILLEEQSNSDGKKIREKQGERQNNKNQIDGENDLKEEKICKAVKRMKKGKAVGIQMEAWLYGDITIRDGFMDLS